LTLLWILVVPFLILLAVVTIVDVVRHPYSGGVKAVWIAFVIVLPVIAAAIYWLSRKPSRAGAEQAYLVGADARAHANHSSSDRTGF
jgi:hypothetical protein